MAIVALAFALVAGSASMTAGPAAAAVGPTFDRAWATGNGGFSLPVGIASNPSSGAVYVTDLFNHRIERHDVDGTFLGQFGAAGTANGQFNLPSAVAVAPDGSVYVADTGNNRIQKFSATGTFQTAWGTLGTANGQFNGPTGVAVDPSGNVFVADTGNDRVQKFTATGTFRTRWGRSGAAEGRLRGPSGVAVSADRRVYVVDAGNDRVQQFSGTGTFRHQWGSSGSGDGRFHDAYGVAVDQAGDVYVSDRTDNRVERFSATGAFITSWGGTGGGGGQFQGAQGVAVAPDGIRILVADKDNSRVQRFAPTTLPGAQPTFVNAWGTAGSGAGQFTHPYSVAIDSAGNVLVADTGGDRIQRFSSTGTFLGEFGTPGTGNGQLDQPYNLDFDTAGNIYVADAGNNRVQKFTAAGAYVTKWGTFGNGNGQFNSPRGIAVDASNNVYVSDSGGDRIQKFTSTGTYLTQWGSEGSASNELNSPQGVAVDLAGNVYVADAINIRVQKFSPSGAFLAQFGTAGSGNGQFAGVTDVAVDAAGNVYVTESINHRVHKLNASGGFLTRWGGLGSGNGQFAQPQGIAVGPSGTIYVADTTNNRIQGFAAGTATNPAVALSSDQSSVSPDDPIDYHVTVTNTTATTLTGVTISDPAAPDCEGPVADIAPATSRVVDCTYPTTADDAGPYANTATLRSDQTNAIASNTTTTQVGPALIVTMAAPARVMATGTIAYAIGITNNTAQPLRGIRVTDSGVPVCAGPVADLAAGATTTVNCTLATTDADAGRVVLNVAGVDATATQAAFASAATTVQGRVTGTVTGPGGPIAGAYVLALDRDLLPLHGDTTTNAAGTYQLALDPGRYYLAFLDPSGQTLAEYSNDKTNALVLTTGDLTPVTAGTGPATTNASASLAASGFASPPSPATISGTITDTNGPLAGVWVVAVNGGVRSATRTNAAGQYTVGNLPAGTTYLEFVDPGGTHAIRWYHDDAGGNPTPITLVAGQAVAGADQTLPAA